MDNILLITGGAKRIGRAICLHLATQGWKIAIHYNVSNREAHELCNEINQFSKAIVIQKNLQVLSDFKHLFQQIKLELGTPNLLINNAAIFQPDNIYNVTAQNLESHMSVNCFAPILLMQEFININNNQSTPDEINIINMLDDSFDLTRSRSFLSYSLSKLCLEHATNLFKIQADDNCKINSISPSFTMKNDSITQDQYDKIKKNSSRDKTTLEDICKQIDFILKKC